MIVPQHWAEARAQHRERGRQITIRRFGWSGDSHALAQAMAEQRAAEALQRALSGEKLPRREPRVPYNGAQGVPIREEIVARHDDVVITRNAYGARCLNTPDVLFGDVDFSSAAPFRLKLAMFGVLASVALMLGWRSGSILLGLGALAVALFAGYLLSEALYRLVIRVTGGQARRTRVLIERFLAAHPDWGLRLYQTPNGWRMLVTHRLFAADEPEVAAFFAAIGADPLYARMCRNQQCFRARVSAKPWRIGIATHLKPRPGVWPVRPERMAGRSAWIAHYENEAARFAACTLVAVLGNQQVHPKVATVSALHDSLCRATTSGLAIA